MHRIIKILAGMALLVSNNHAPAQVYIIDRDFGRCGAAALDLDVSGQPELKELKTLTDGKILLAGIFRHDGSDSISILLVQYGPDGLPDTSGFAANGVLLSRINLVSYINGITVQPDGKIIAIGHANNSVLPANDIPALYRFSAVGEFDSTLNATGVVAMRFDAVSSGSLYKVIVLSDNKIVAAGLSVKNGGNGTNGIGLLKISSIGDPDLSFGNIPGFPGRSRLEMDSASAIHLFSMNNKLVLPFIQKNNGFDTVKIARVLENGNVDNGFGTNGILNTGMRSENLSAILQQDGKLLMGGTLPGTPRRIQLLRYTDMLVPDPSFGVNGYVLVPTIGDPGSDNGLYEVSQQEDGKILIIGYVAPAAFPSNVRPFILRLLENGELDSSFNGTGNMPVNSEFLSGWRNIAPGDSTDFLISRTPSFELLKYVPDNSLFGNAAEADFDFTVEKQNVLFTERSVNGLYFDWDFGDGNFSSLANPLHTYAQPGSYTVTLNVAGPCDGATATKQVEVRGIHKITPDTGPGSGLTICHIYGYGFDQTSQVFLKKDTVTLTPEFIFFDAATQTLQANFSFLNASLGVYDLIVTTGTRNDTLPQSFTILQKDIGQPWVQLVGPYNRFFRALTGERVNTYRLEYGVNGNATHYMIPLSVVVSGSDLQAEMLTPISNRSDTTGLPDSLKPAPNGFYRDYDEISGDSVWVFYALAPVVEANTTHSLEFTVTSTTTMGDFGVYGYIGKSLFDTQQLDSLYARTGNTGFCSNNCITCLLELAGFIPGPAGCVAGIISTACSVNNMATAPLTVGSMLNLAISFASTGIACGTMTGSAFGKLLQAFQQTLLGYTLRQASIGAGVTSCTAAVLNMLSSGNCNGGSGQTGGRFPRTGSFDPNIKVGPASYNTRHYIAAKEPLNYNIHFENLAAATAPAYRVVITDTIDKSVLDIASLQFGSVTIAQKSYPVFSTKNGFEMDIPITGRPVLARVKGTVDTATGVVTWLFSSLDSATRDWITDQANGFLPPNTDSITGTGAVSFSIKQKPTNTHLTAISNIATIVFDFNAPIRTALWTNIVDTVKPQSAVSNQFRVINDSTFSVKWAGTDADAGIRDYSIYVSDNDTAYTLLGIFGKDSTLVKGMMGRTYKFISIAADSVNNRENPPADPLSNPDAVFIFNAALPVKLLSFNASRENETALLRWSAGAEVNSSHFIVEHSTDGNRFTGIATVNAAQNSSTQTDYHYRHLKPAPGSNFYRLRMVDRDGKYEYSPVRVVKFEQARSLTLSPNPASNTVTVYTAEPGGILRLISSTGKIMKETGMSGNKTVLDISGLAPGIYLVSYQSPRNNYRSEKLLVQREY